MNRDKLVLALCLLLFLSLTANVFVGSLLMGEAYSASSPGHEEHHGDWKKKEAALRRELSASDQAALTAATKGKHEQFHTMHDALEVAKQRVETAQNAEPFDPKALQAALEDELSKKAAVLKLIRQAHDDIQRRLSPEGRVIFRKIVRDANAPPAAGSPEASSHKPGSPAQKSAGED